MFLVFSLNATALFSLNCTFKTGQQFKHIFLDLQGDISDKGNRLYFKEVIKVDFTCRRLSAVNTW